MSVTRYSAGELFNAAGQSVGHKALRKEVVLAYDYDAVVAERDSRITMLLGAVRAEQNTVAAQAARIAELEDAHRQQIEAMRGTRDGMQRELMAVTTERDALQQRLGSLSGALSMAITQNSCDMLMTGDEIRRCEAALSPPPVEAGAAAHNE